MFTRLKQMAVRLPEDVVDEFREYCVKEGFVIRKVVEKLFREYLSQVKNDER